MESLSVETGLAKIVMADRFLNISDFLSLALQQATTTC